MAWKNIKQQSLTDSFSVEHSALDELGDVNRFTNRSEAETLLNLEKAVRELLCQ